MLLMSLIHHSCTPVPVPPYSTTLLLVLTSPSVLRCISCTKEAHSMRITAKYLRARRVFSRFRRFYVAGCS